MKRALLALACGVALAFLVRRAVKGWPVVLVLLLTSCASLPQTNTPLCEGIAHVVCRAPVEIPRSYLWESQNACPMLADDITPCNCYRPTGVKDQRQVYAWFSCPKPKEETDPEGTKG